jgi:hypothetical protein
MRQDFFVLSLLALSFCVVRAQAVSSLEVINTPAPFPPPAVQNDLYVSFDFSLAQQHLTVHLTAGSIIYDACPSCDPSDLRYQTSVFLGSPNNSTNGHNYMTFTAMDLDVTWESMPFAHFNLDDYHVARVFLTPDAQGSWTYQGEETALAALIPAAPTIRGTISGGVMAIVPEPTAVALTVLATAALALSRRHGS